MKVINMHIKVNIMLYFMINKNQNIQFIIFYSWSELKTALFNIAASGISISL